MKKFTTKIITLLGLAVFLAVLLDLAYTTIFVYGFNRTKVDAVFHGKKEQYDVVMLGSSRANNHFVPSLFEEKGLKTFNYGMSGGHLFEADLMLKLMLERKYQIKTVLLEADLNLSNDQRAEGIASKFLPYLHSSKVIQQQFQNEADYNYLYYIPFYRYIEYDAQIGFREVYKKIKEEKTNQFNNQGYYPLGVKPNASMKNNISKLKPLQNHYYESIKRLCNQHNIRLITVMTPMCANTIGMEYFEKVQKLYPEIYNYENAVTDDNYFSSCGHLNDAGAKLFTARILKDFF
ncbi:hypothetical protein [Flavobacterium agrisoli]|uniref:Uncharacterized protein n=1 Tax=Flavobacterium agrisoli TaxID=2793066 RepID=A0A934PQE3_9FLAO|nr:hypothetical protein [Flavobacterium agrisoli]MBK0370723.1 hypothetical protein [Flavobacterium agrisoli]